MSLTHYRQLITIAVALVPANLKIGEEALDRLMEADMMFMKFIPLEIVLEIRRREPAPVYHLSLYDAVNLGADYRFKSAA